MKNLAEKLREVFAQEATTDLAALEAALAALHPGPPVPSVSELAKVFQLAHKIKGACRAVGFRIGQTYGHQIEYLFRALHEKPVELEPALLQDAQTAFVAFAQSVRDYLAGQRVQLDIGLFERMNSHLTAAGSAHPAELPQITDVPADASPTPDPTPTTPPATKPSEARRGELNQRLLQSFRAEAAEILETLHRELDKPLDNPHDPPDFAAALRAAHTLKGAAHVVKLEAVASQAHELESLLRRGVEAQDTPDWPTLLAEARKLLHTIENNLGEQLASAATAAPPASTPTASPAPNPAPPADSTPAAAAFYRVERERITKLEEAFSEVLAGLPRLEGLCAEAVSLQNELGSFLREEEVLRGGLASFLYRAPENREHARAASYVNHASRQLRLLQRSLQRLESRLRRTASLLESRIEVLDRELHGLQVTRAGEVLAGLRPMVADLAEHLGKPVDLQVRGFEIGMELPVLQRLRGALVHLLRNAVDHGIEPPEARRATGKPARATITLELALAGGNYQLRISDDGRGLPLAEIRQAAVAAGLVSADQAATLPPEALARFIFRGNFSTARQLTQISGRGVGLASVEETIQSLGGEVSCQSTPGIGTTFILRFPASRAGSRALLVRCAGQTFALPMRAIRRVTQFAPADIQVHDQGAHWLHEGETLSAARLSDLLALPPEPAADSSPAIALMESGGQTWALLVDAVLGAQQVVLRELPPGAAKNRLFGGWFPLDDGEAGLLLEPEALWQTRHGTSHQHTAFTTESSEAPAPAPNATPSILVVDDSYTSRTLEAGVIESLGYRVFQAADGLEGLRVLRGEQVDLILCDIEMPRLDGFGMLAEVKKHHRFRDIPFILISSLEDPSVIEKGLALGADSYIVKRLFEQGDLRETIRHYL